MPANPTPNAPEVVEHVDSHPEHATGGQRQQSVTARRQGVTQGVVGRHGAHVGGVEGGEGHRRSVRGHDGGAAPDAVVHLVAARAHVLRVDCGAEFVEGPGPPGFEGLG